MLDGAAPRQGRVAGVDGIDDGTVLEANRLDEFGAGRVVAPGHAHRFLAVLLEKFEDPAEVRVARRLRVRGTGGLGVTSFGEENLLNLAIDRYDDEAFGVLAKNEAGKMFMSKITLRPKIAFSGDKTPSADELSALHHSAHEECFIATSLKSEITVEG